MQTFPNHRPFTLLGRWSFRLRSLAMMLRCGMKTALRRMARGPLLENWSWTLEAGTLFLRDQLRYAFELPDPAEGREYLDSLVPYSSSLAKVGVESGAGRVRGVWLTPDAIERERAILYLHGGGYWMNMAAELNTGALHADLTGLPPIYIQAGGSEIFIDMITAFSIKAEEQGAQVEIEVWEGMNHMFQAYGDQLPHSREALLRIGQILDQHLAPAAARQLAAV